MNPLQDAFISYGRADSKHFAKHLNERLTDLGYTVWFDFNDIPLGVDYQKQIDDGIEKADNFLFLISPHSVNSKYCRLEIELALQRKKRIIPLLHVEEISHETWQQRHSDGTDEQWEAYKAAGKHSSFPNMHPEIGKINWIYFREELDDFETSLQGLLDLLAQAKDYIHQHTVLLNEALEWERNQKQTRYLLTGEARQQAEDWLAVRFRDCQPPVIPTDLHYEYITESIKNAHNLMTQVFLSHAEEDGEVTEKLRRTLMRAGMTTWSYRSDIAYGSDFQTAIVRGVEEADTVLLVMSTHSLNSEYCRQEIDLALQLNKRILIMLAGTTDETQIPVALRNLQYIDLTDNQTEADYLQDEDNLLRVLKQDATYYNEHKVLLTKALKWERQQRNPCILLQGYELQHALAWQEVAQNKEAHGPTALQQEFIQASKNQTAAVAPDVFISYSRADSDFARKLNNALQRQRKRTWFDQESIASGTDFQKEIYKGIETSTIFLFVLSPRAVKSPYCADEVQYAAKLNKRMVTVLHHPVETADLHPELAKVQWIDFTAHEGEFDANFKELLRTLDMDSAHLKYHTQLLVKAIEWHEKGQREEVLLRGDDLTEAEHWMLQAVEKKPSPTVLQGEYVAASRAAIAASQQAAAKQQKTTVQLLGSLLIFAILGVIIALYQSRVATKLQAQAQQAEKHALNAKIQAETRTVESLMAAELNLQSLLQALELGQHIQTIESQAPVNVAANSISIISTQAQNGPSNPEVTSANRLRAVSVLREMHHQGYLPYSVLKHSRRVTDTALTPDGKVLASASTDGTLTLWNRSGPQPKPWKGHEDWINSVAFSPDGKTLASASDDGTVKLWDTQGQIIKTLNSHHLEVTSVAFSPDSKTLVSASLDGTVKFWDVKFRDTQAQEGLTVREAQTFDGHSTAVNSMAFSRDGKILASASFDGTVKLWDIQGQELQIWQGHSVAVNSMAFSPDGKILASASWDDTVKLWDTQGQELRELVTLAGHTDVVWNIAFSHDGKTLASASKDGTVKLWNIREQELLRTLKGHAEAVNGVVFSPTDNILASASADGTVKLWNRSGKEPQTLEGHDGVVNSVAFSPDGNTLASASADGTVKHWDKDGDELGTWNSHLEGVVRVAFSPDGEILASIGSDRTIKLWDRDGKELQTLAGHDGVVNSVAFFPDSETLASASFDGTVKLWDTSGQELQTLYGHGDGVLSVMVSPDGKTLASTDTDGNIILWNLDLDDLMAKSCDRLRDYMNYNASKDEKKLCANKLNLP